MAHETQFFGIYGFEITRTIKLGSFSLHPRTTDSKTASGHARDTDNFNLTAVGQFHEILGPRGAYEVLHDLSDAMTFCEQQWVAISRAYKMAEGMSAEQAMGKFPVQLDIPFKRYTRGQLIQSDSERPDQRRTFLELCLAKLADVNFTKETYFREAFSRNVESWKLQKEFLDLTYYLDFSALEIVARRARNDELSPVAEVLVPFLKGLGYQVMQTNHGVLHLGMQNYADVRNALFHNGKFEKVVKDSRDPNKEITLRLVDFDQKLRFLLPDVLLKLMGYDDPHINWNRWIDRMAFFK